MGFARQGIEPVTQGAVDPLDMDRPRFAEQGAEHGANLNGEQRSMLVTMLDRLRQAHIRGYPQRRPSRSTAVDGLTIRAGQNLRRATPSIAAPVQWTTLRARDGESHCSLDEIIADASSGTSGDEAARAILYQTSPAFSGIGLVRSSVFFGQTTRIRQFRPLRDAHLG